MYYRRAQNAAATRHNSLIFAAILFAIVVAVGLGLGLGIGLSGGDSPVPTPSPLPVPTPPPWIAPSPGPSPPAPVPTPTVPTPTPPAPVPTPAVPTPTPPAPVPTPTAPTPTPPAPVPTPTVPTPTPLTTRKLFAADYTFSGSICMYGGNGAALFYNGYWHARNASLVDVPMPWTFRSCNTVGTGCETGVIFTDWCLEFTDDTALSGQSLIVQAIISGASSTLSAMKTSYITPSITLPGGQACTGSGGLLRSTYGHVTTDSDRASISVTTVVPASCVVNGNLMKLLGTSDTILDTNSGVDIMVMSTY